jgi:hypothetical protein
MQPVQQKLIVNRKTHPIQYKDINNPKGELYPGYNSSAVRVIFMGKTNVKLTVPREQRCADRG